jgi:hypothetical protein
MTAEQVPLGRTRVDERQHRGEAQTARAGRGRVPRRTDAAGQGALITLPDGWIRQLPTGDFDAFRRSLGIAAGGQTPSTTRRSARSVSANGTTIASSSSSPISDNASNATEAAMRQNDPTRCARRSGGSKRSHGGGKRRKAVRRSSSSNRLPPSLADTTEDARSGRARGCGSKKPSRWCSTTHPHVLTYRPDRTARLARFRSNRSMQRRCRRARLFLVQYAGG